MYLERKLAASASHLPRNQSIDRIAASYFFLQSSQVTIRHLLHSQAASPLASPFFSRERSHFPKLECLSLSLICDFNLRDDIDGLRGITFVKQRLHSILR